MSTLFIIIAIIVVAIIVKFAFSSAKQSREIKSQGGIRNKYSTIIDYILSCDPNTKIFKETNTLVSVGASGIAGSQIFYIQAAFETVTIQMEVKNNPLFGDMQLHWSFPENMEQEEMIKVMFRDIEKEINSRLPNNYNE